MMLVSLVIAMPAWAQPRTGPAATQHALDELANCRAQAQLTGRPRPECATDTPTPTVPPTVTLTPIPASTPTDLPTDSPEPTATPLPVLPAPPQGDDPALGYTRPLGDGWLELALPQGRWAVHQADDCGSQVEAWSAAWLTTANDGEVDLNTANVACGLATAVWQSDAPCALDDQGICQLVLDASYWDMLGRTPTAVPSDTPTPRPQAPPSTPRPAAPARAPAPQVQVRTVVRTVVVEVEVTPEPTDTPVVTPTDRPTLTPTQTATVTPTATGTSTVPPLAVAPPTGSALESVSHVTSSAPGRWDWRTFLTGVAVVVLVIGLAFCITTRRRVVVWRARRDGAR
jgi:hypothetical protein